MNTVLTELTARAKSLPPTERACLIETLIESMLHTDGEIQAAWAQEAESRVDAIARGEMPVGGEPKALSDFRKRLK